MESSNGKFSISGIEETKRALNWFRFTSLWDVLPTACKCTYVYTSKAPFERQLFAWQNHHSYLLQCSEIALVTNSRNKLGKSQYVRNFLTPWKAFSLSHFSLQMCNIMLFIPFYLDYLHRVCLSMLELGNEFTKKSNAPFRYYFCTQKYTHASTKKVDTLICRSRPEYILQMLRRNWPGIYLFLYCKHISLIGFVENDRIKITKQQRNSRCRWYCIWQQQQQPKRKKKQKRKNPLRRGNTIES